MASMPKNIVVCCDGTANEFAQDRTNVIKLSYTLQHASGQQIVYYHPGLGTMEPADALTPFAQKTTRLLGQAIGYGLESDVRDAYVFLMNNFEPGDRVFLFGFSRGAYTVRALASLLHMYGLISSGNEPLVPYAIRMLTAIQKLDARAIPGARRGSAISRWRRISRTPSAEPYASHGSWACGTRLVRSAGSRTS
jgi:uncharacterized protein (DUF2235 family)